MIARSDLPPTLGVIPQAAPGQEPIHLVGSQKMPPKRSAQALQVSPVLSRSGPGVEFAEHDTGNKDGSSFELSYEKWPMPTKTKVGNEDRAIQNPQGGTARQDAFPTYPAFSGALKRQWLPKHQGPD